MAIRKFYFPNILIYLIVSLEWNVPKLAFSVLQKLHNSYFSLCLNEMLLHTMIVFHRFQSIWKEPINEYLFSDDGPELPMKSSDEFKPFMRRLPEFKFWYVTFYNKHENCTCLVNIKEKNNLLCLHWLYLYNLSMYEL